MVEVTLEGKMQFLGLPPDLQEAARPDQLLGTDAECLIEAAARTCYDSFGKGRPSNEHHAHIREVEHGSVLRHAQFTFRIRNVSRGLTHELVRHGAGCAPSQRSTRFVDESEAPYCIHPALRKFLSDPEVSWTDKARLQSKMAVAMETSRDAYADIVRTLEPYLVKCGMEKVPARKQARGAGRGFLGNGIETELVWSVNIQALLHVLHVRGDAGADGEIRELAEAVYRCVRDEAPEYFKDIEVILGCPDGAPVLAEVKSF